MGCDRPALSQREFLLFTYNWKGHGAVWDLDSAVHACLRRHRHVNDPWKDGMKGWVALPSPSHVIELHEIVKIADLRQT